MADIKAMFAQITADGVVTRDEHDELMEEIHADGKIDAEENAIISELFKLMKEGKIKIVDSEREKAEYLRRQELQEKLTQMVGGDTKE
ncbi:MAG: hypothetical protein IT292_11560 [Deltaproteobacteria bacterium]|nr:hypothetical protein [Deltaproteobacteria bacterium]